MTPHELGEAKGHSRRKVRPLEVERVLREVATEYRLHPRDIRSRGRRPHLVAARREVWRRLAAPDVSLASIARAWPCDHHTINAGLGRFTRRGRNK